MDGIYLLESSLIYYKENAKKLDMEEKQLEFLKKMKSNNFSNIHLFLPIIEIPIISYIVLSTFLITHLPFIQIILIAILIVCLIDMSYLHELVYKKIDSTRKPFKRYINIFRRIRKNHKVIEEELRNIHKRKLDNERELGKCKVELEEFEEQKKSLLAELDTIRKSIGSIMEEENTMSQENEIMLNRVANFVNKRKLELKP